MLKTALAALAAALALTAPPALAHPPVLADCGFDSDDALLQPGPDHRAFLYGVVAHGGTEQVSITCYLKVNGVERARTPIGTGTGAAVTYGTVTYTAGELDYLDLCVAATVAGHPADEFCVAIGDNTQIPPYEVVALLCTVVDPADCD